MIDAWEAINANQTDTNSPLDQPLMDALRLRGDTLFDWVGKNYTPTDDHGHDGTDSKFVTLGRSATSTSQSIGAAAQFYPDTAIGGWSCDANVQLEFFLNSSWISSGGGGAEGEMILGDGGSGFVRFNHTAGGSESVYYLNLDDID